MNRIHVVLGYLVAAGGLGALAPLVTGCGGRSIDEGASTQMQPVGVAAIRAPASACNTGWAHPNVCCEAGPASPASCGDYPSAPFHACDSGYTTYPDPRSCCPLDGTGNCAAPPPPPVSVPPAASCVYACPPGQFSPQGAASGACCEVDAQGTTTCYAQAGYGTAQNGSTGAASAGSGGSAGASGTAGASGGGSEDASAGASCAVGCACPACAPGEPCPPCDCPPPPPDCTTPPPPPPTCGVACACPECPAGASCPPCDCPPSEPCPPPQPVCGSCPPGWQMPANEPYLCCQEESDGVIACFSQAVSPSSPASPPQPEPSQPTPVEGSAPAGAAGG